MWEKINKETKMRFDFCKRGLVGLVLAVTLLGNIANAGLITGNLNVDDAFTVYISTDDSIAGTEILSGAGWKTTFSFNNYSLTDGVDYYLHVHGRDIANVIAGFLGDFTLSGTGHVFSNLTTSALTNATGWQVSTSGWNNYQQASTVGQNGDSPWGLRSGVNSNAQWIWSRSGAASHLDNDTYFSLAITATNLKTEQIPEPSTIAIFALGIIGLASRRFKKQS